MKHGCCIWSSAWWYSVVICNLPGTAVVGLRLRCETTRAALPSYNYKLYIWNIWKISTNIFSDIRYSLCFLLTVSSNWNCEFYSHLPRIISSNAEKNQKNMKISTISLKYETIQSCYFSGFLEMEVIDTSHFQYDRMVLA